MDFSMILIGLGGFIVLMAVFASSVGLFYSRSKPYTFKSLRGQNVHMYGGGIYRFDTLFIGAGFRGSDAVILFLSVPLLVVALFLYARNSSIGGLLLVGVLSYFLYVYASMALGAAYNQLFLAYVVLFSASLFAFILAFSAVDLDFLTVRSAGVPRLGLALFLFASGLVTLFVWGAPLISALIQGSPPARLDTYTTPVTYALDLAVITPSTILSGVLILQGSPLGILIAVPLLTLIIFLVPQIILSTIFQKSAGVPFTRAEMVGPVAGFVVLGVLAIWFLTILLQNYSGMV